MGNTYINIVTKGDGSVSFVSSSGTGSLISSTDLNGSGIYMSGSDYKFLLNKKCISINSVWTEVDPSGNIYSSSISMKNDNAIRIQRIGSILNLSQIPTCNDRSFTIISASGNLVYDIKYDVDVLFYPKLDYAPLLIKKSSAYSKVETVEPYINSNIDNRIIEAVASGREQPTTVDYTNGYMYRYFYKRLNSPTAIIRELLKKQYDIISTNTVYKSIRIKWKITGREKSEVESTNNNTIENADTEMYGIYDFLKKNLSLYWKEGK